MSKLYVQGNILKHIKNFFQWSSLEYIFMLYIYADCFTYHVKMTREFF